MFNLRLTSKREVLLWQATIEDLKQERARLVAEAKHERERAEAILNILLARTTGMAVAAPSGEETVNRQQQELMELFGTEETDQEEILNKLQS